MGLETVYVRHKFSAFKTDEKGFERIIKYYGDVNLSISVSLRQGE